MVHDKHLYWAVVAITGWSRLTAPVLNLALYLFGSSVIPNVRTNLTAHHHLGGCLTVTTTLFQVCLEG